MDPVQAKRLMLEIPRTARVVDVGGGAAPFARADHVIDALPFDRAGEGSDGHSGVVGASRIDASTWTQVDLCARKPWPFENNSFDFAVCSHVLEDVRDPVWVCSELSRIARAGYIETPSRIVEQSLGVESPAYAGYCHHRWLVSRRGSTLEFRHKPHMLHAVDEAIVAALPPTRKVCSRYATVHLRWEGAIDAREVLEFNEGRIIDELCRYAERARHLGDLTEAVPMSLGKKWRKHVLYRRLAAGRRCA